MTQDADCIFCRIVDGTIPCVRLYETDRVLSFMDINPFHDGHCLVIPKAHAENLAAIPDEDLAAVAVAARKVAGAVTAELAPEGFNLIQANGPAAGQSVFHFHFHIFPRAPDDEARMNWGHRAGDMERIQDLGRRIAARLEA